MTELVRAILQDEPIKMRRLAEIFHVDVSSMNAMWILHCDSPQDRRMLPEKLEDVRGAAEVFCPFPVSGMYEGDLVVFTDGPQSLSDKEALSSSLLSIFSPSGPPVTLTRCCNLIDPTGVRAAFFMNRDHLGIAKRIFPGRNCFSLGELDFAKSCRLQIEQGEDELKHAIEPLSLFNSIKDGAELKSTLAVYLLDCGTSVSQTAERLFLHKNTIKYRLQRISDLMGFKVGNMPESVGLYRASALSRLLS